MVPCFGECVLLYGYILIKSQAQLLLAANCNSKSDANYLGNDEASKLVFLYKLLNQNLL